MIKKVEFARQLRRKQTRAEKIFWFHVRNRKFGNLKFRRQVPIDRFVVDFMCESHKLVIELDDCSHNFKIEQDRERTKVI